MIKLVPDRVLRPRCGMYWVRIALLLALPACLPPLAAAAAFEFRAPLSVDDPKVDVVMRDLAERILPVYEESDPERYLDSVSALQLVAGSFAAAVESRKQLSERLRAQHGTGLSRAAVYDLYARAKARQREDHSTFEVSFNKAFQDYVPKLEDAAAYTLSNWLAVSPKGYKLALQNALNRLRLKTTVNDAEATQLMWTYLSYAAYRDMSAVVGPLVAEDDRRRYLFDDEVTLKGPNGNSLKVLVVRPRSGTAALPALLEYTLGGAPGYAKEGASRGYVGVTAYARGKEGVKRFVPFQYDGKAADTVIDWIAAQPWSDGQVGMFGTAYSGFAAWAAAKHRPAALKAIATIAPTAPGIDFPMQGSIFRNAAFRWSLAVTDPNASVSSTFDDATADRRWRALDEKWYRSGKAYRQLGRLSGTPNFLFLRWLNHPSYDGYWQHMIPFKDEFAAISIPTLTITGYYAASEPGALYYFNERAKYNAAADDTLLIGPYDDSRLAGNLSGLNGLKIDPSADVDLHDLRYRWFNSIFKGAARPSIVQQGRVNIEIAGTDAWTHAAGIDTIATSSSRLYLATEHEEGGYRLSPERVASVRSVTQKVDFKDRGDFNWQPNSNFAAKTPEAHNGLVFASRPFADPLDVAGALQGELDLVTNKMDLDITMTLYEQTQQGDYILLTSPATGFRASYAHDRTHRRLLQGGPRQRIRFASERLLGRRLKAGSRLVLILGLNKRADQEINYGSDKDVSAASRADAGRAATVQWFNDSYIEIPIHK